MVEGNKEKNSVQLKKIECVQRLKDMIELNETLPDHVKYSAATYNDLTNVMIMVLALELAEQN